MFQVSQEMLSGEVRDQSTRGFYKYFYLNLL